MAHILLQDIVEVRKRSVTLQASSIYNDIKCVICLNVIVNCHVGRECLHRFCKICIFKHVTDYKKKCPVCNASINRRVIRPDPDFDNLVNDLKNRLPKSINVIRPYKTPQKPIDIVNKKSVSSQSFNHNVSVVRKAEIVDISNKQLGAVLPIIRPNADEIEGIDKSLLINNPRNTCGINKLYDVLTGNSKYCEWYVAKIVTMNSNGEVKLHFPFWTSRNDYFGLIQELYIADYGVFTMPAGLSKRNVYSHTNASASSSANKTHPHNNNHNNNSTKKSAASSSSSKPIRTQEEKLKQYKARVTYDAEFISKPRHSFRSHGIQNGERAYNTRTRSVLAEEIPEKNLAEKNSGTDARNHLKRKGAMTSAAPNGKMTRRNPKDTNESNSPPFTRSNRYSMSRSNSLHNKKSSMAHNINKNNNINNSAVYDSDEVSIQPDSDSGLRNQENNSTNMPANSKDEWHRASETTSLFDSDSDSDSEYYLKELAGSDSEHYLGFGG